jgi:hypothetical protein
VVHEYACAMQQPLYVENWLRRLHVQDPNVHGLTTRARRLVFFLLTFHFGPLHALWLPLGSYCTGFGTCRQIPIFEWGNICLREVRILYHTDTQVTYLLAFCATLA